MSQFYWTFKRFSTFENVLTQIIVGRVLKDLGQEVMMSKCLTCEKLSRERSGQISINGRRDR